MLHVSYITEKKIKYVCYESQKLQGVYNDTLKMPKAVERIKEYYKVENVYFYQDQIWK